MNHKIDEILQIYFRCRIVDAYKETGGRTATVQRVVSGISPLSAVMTGFIDSSVQC